MGKSSPRPVVCRGCNTEFITCWGKQVFCTKKCRGDFFNAGAYKATVDRGACSVADCDKPALAKELCNMHYTRMFHHGSTDDPAIARRKKRFWAKVDQTDTCWNWVGRKDKAGYGAVGLGGGRGTSAHRFAYLLTFGSVPKELDHICHNRGCVNPDHLRPVTRSQNLQNLSGARSDSKSGVRGVHWHKRAGKWCAQVSLGGKNHQAGLFDTLEEAEAAAIAKRNELFTHNEMDRRTA